MRPETRQSLADAQSAAEKILRIAVPGWTEDQTVALAVERLLIIVGEALVRVRRTEEKVLDRLGDAYKVIGMRNVLVHGYDALDPARIQAAVEQSLPKLIGEIRSLLDE